MQFNTYGYILGFLPIVVIGYHALNQLKNSLYSKFFLIAASIVFYTLGGFWKQFIWLMVSMAVNYLIVFLIKKWKVRLSKVADNTEIDAHKKRPGSQTLNGRKFLLLIGILFNILLLFYFKYSNFAITTYNQLFHQNRDLLNLILPLGISFYTFQQIIYLVDSFHGKLDHYSLLDYILYILYFPKILMGPIVKPENLIPQFHDENRKKLDKDKIMKGIRMFNIGLFKKVILADTFARSVSWAWGLGDFNKTTSMDMILVMLAYTYQIYFDFSGYSDMAIGSSLMLGIDLPVNFDSPYKAYSIRDFWKRWHISLTKFLTEYIYFPLGGSKKGKTRTVINSMIVFLISGIWHGANWTFILWGLLNGIFSIFDRLTEKLRKNANPVVQWFFTFLIINVLWLLFRSNSISEWKTLLFHMGTFRNMAISNGLIQSFVLPETKVFISLAPLNYLNKNIRGFPMLIFYLLAFILCLGFENSSRKKYSSNIVTAILSALLFIFCLTCLGGDTSFIYNGF